MPENIDSRHHVKSFLMRESLLDKGVMASSKSTNIVKMLPQVDVIKIGGASMIDKGKKTLFPLIDTVIKELKSRKIVIGVGAGIRTRHMFSIGLDLGLPTGVLADLSRADALGNANIITALLTANGVVSLPPAEFGHLLPMALESSSGVVYTGIPPYGLWEHPPSIGRIPPHRSDTGCYILAETFGCRSCILIKDVDGLYSEDPRINTNATFIPEISVSELKKKNFDSLPFDRVLIDILENARLMKSFQIINGNDPENLSKALAGEKIGTIIHAD